ncbi:MULTISPECIES: dipeptidase [Mesorhizobium]|uniref:Membrane dipeptidase n=1 Tax=Mesorhizobium muleiense TaxID=1004279 RepID=A0A1G9L861_9HYPH|nr:MULTISPECIES: dipeptidase [Mesorhizobium]MCF6098521.1 dipeptidase [Mesorhizobium muleiense]RUV28989.1 membrane dipeptidase [Mesorhizobium sp. M5C.F.Ca.IN.020.32.2.1]TIU93453.1 MAG: membrane dipeptidase [Mesorhizobium sp.]SDL57937.1 membrane dipeptidase [Mesorhizobium muleiense]
MQEVFDGHNDVLYRLWNNATKGGDPVAEFVEGTQQGHIDMPRARKGGLAGGLCAIYVTSPNMQDEVRDENGHYAIPLSQPLERSPSLDIAVDMASIAFRIESAGGWKICRSSADIDAAEAECKFAAVLHMEGCEAIDAELAALDVFYSAGLRSLGPVWSRNTVFGQGVPFAFPSSPDTGPGLTEAGKRLVTECNRIGIAVDLAHITEKGFWDVARLSDQPLIVSHSNAHAITPISRNLTDKQLAAVRESNGLVGLNFAVTMLREDGLKRVDTPLSDMIRHIDYLVEHVGIDGVGLGSDFDGTTVPAEIGDVAGLQNLVAALRDAGYGDTDLAKICHDNWLRVLRSAWHEAAA